MTDYSQLSDAELSRRIAELRGFRVYHYRDLNPYYQLWDSEGIPVVLGRGQRAIEAEAWQDAPCYASDMNAAVELLREMVSANAGLYPHENGRWVCVFNRSMVALYAEDVSAEHENPARAVSECWLQWREGQKP